MSLTPHEAGIARLRADVRSQIVVPVSPNSSGIPLLVDGRVYARFGCDEEARSAAHLLKDCWPAAEGRRIAVGR